MISKLIIHFIALSGARKTTTGKLLAKNLNILYFDMDEYFIENDPFTFLLIPSLDLDECVEIIKKDNY